MGRMKEHFYWLLEKMDFAVMAEDEDSNEDDKSEFQEEEDNRDNRIPYRKLSSRTNKPKQKAR